MLTKNEIKYIQSLYQKKHRDEAQLFVAEGPKLAQELLGSGYSIKHVYATAAWLQKNHLANDIATEISPIELGRISHLETPNEVVVVASQQQLVNKPVFKNTLSLLLDGIQDPGNMGTIIRIADWFGITQIICSEDCVDIYNPKVVQSTMGSIARVNCWYKDFSDLQIEKSIPVFGALLKGENIYKIEKITEGVLVIGNESKGIREPLLSKIDRPVTIPKAGGAESLNAAVAAGIIIGTMVNG